MRDKIIHDDIFLFGDGLLGLKCVVHAHDERPYQATLPDTPEPVREVARHRLKLQQDIISVSVSCDNDITLIRYRN